MVVGNFNFTGISVLPDKTDAPLIVDSYAVLTFSVSFQGLKPVAWWNPEILKAPGLIKVQEFSPGDPIE